MLLAAGIDKIGLRQALERVHGPVAEVCTKSLSWFPPNFGGQTQIRKECEISTYVSHVGCFGIARS